jgi:hypothetical protein
VGSGLTQSAEQQMTNLARNAALVIENWLAENPHWFDPAMDAPPPTGGAAGGGA